MHPPPMRSFLSPPDKAIDEAEIEAVAVVEGVVSVHQQNRDIPLPITATVSLPLMLLHNTPSRDMDILMPLHRALSYLCNMLP